MKKHSSSNLNSVNQVIPGAITNQDIPKIKDIIDNLEKHKYCYTFLEPVQHVELGLSDYLQIVKKPMDISTIKKNLNNLVYNSVQEVINDIMLIWSNCKNYNIEGSDIHDYACTLEKYSKKLIDKYYKVKYNKPESKLVLI